MMDLHNNEKKLINDLPLWRGRRGRTTEQSYSAFHPLHPRQRGKFSIFIYGSLFLILALGIFPACEQEEGCLDANATNFAPGADKDCGSDCCDYPKLKLRLFPQNNGTGYSVNDTLSDIAGNLYVLSDARFYMSDVRLVRDNGEEVGVQDTIKLVLTNGTSEVLADNYVLVAINTFSYEVGEIAGTGDFESIKFNIGLDETAHQVYADTMATTHPLSDENGMYVDEANGYLFQETELTMVPDTLTSLYGVVGANNLQAISLDFDSTIVVTKGFDIEIQLDVDYPGLFETIDFLNDDDNMIQQKIVSNMPDIFSIR